MAGALIVPSAEVQPAAFQKMFGANAACVQSNDPSTLVRKNADAIRGRTTIRVSVGDEDSLQVRDKAFHELLNELKIEHDWELVPGVAHAGVKFYDKLGDRAFLYYQKALSNKAPNPLT
jgi:hypothetical protein